MSPKNTYQKNTEAEKARLEALHKSGEGNISITRRLSEIETDLYLLARGQHWTQQDYPEAEAVAAYVQKRRTG